MKIANSISQIGLPQRIIHTLLENNIETIEDLLSADLKDISRLTNIGSKRLKLIIDALKELKVETKNPEEEIQEHNTHRNMSLKEIHEIVFEESCNAFQKLLAMVDGKELLVPAIRDALQEMKKEIHLELFREINELRTIVLEQSRILEGMQSIDRDNGILNKINDKIPGFATAIYAMHKELEQC